MSEEIFDVVDEADQVVDRRPRSEVHRLGLRHRAVHILVFNARGQVFLQRRSWIKDCAPGTWDSSASGHLNAGEDYAAASVRELHEELGWTPAATPHPLFKVEARAETGQEFVWLYRSEGEGPFRLHPEEILEGGWFDPERVDAWMGDRPEEFAPSFRWIWQEFNRRGGPSLARPA